MTFDFVGASTDPPGCAYSLSLASRNFAASGGDSNFAINAGSGCSWPAVSNDSWITIDAGGTGLGPGTVNYSVSRNNGALRTGTINIGGQIFTVEQKAGDTGQ